MLETVYVNPAKEVNTRKGEKPTVTAWKKQPMIRNHSIRAAVREVINHVKETGLVSIGILGKPGSGKTTLAKCIGHLIHEMADEPFAVKIFDKEGLLHLRETITNLEPMNHVLILDDLSFIQANASKQQIDQIKQTATEIRHLPGGKDVRIVLILNWHYSKALDKYMRGTEFLFVTNVSSSENENLQQIFGKEYTKRINDFQKMCSQAIVKKIFHFRLGKKGYFTYEFKKPFIPTLFYNSISLRYVVSPTREWIDPICSVCSNISKDAIKSNVDLDKFADDLTYKFGPSVARQAVRLKCFQSGVNVYPKRVRKCMDLIDHYFKTGVFDIEALAQHYHFDNTSTRLDEKINPAIIAT